MASQSFSQYAICDQPQAHKRAHFDGYKYVADPNFVDVPVERLLSKDYAAEIRSQIDAKKAWHPTFYHDGYVAAPAGELVEWNGFTNIDPRSHSTTHFLAIDREGNMVSITETLGGWFGAGPGRRCRSVSEQRHVVV